MAGGLAEQLWRARCDGGTLPRHAADGVRATEDAYCVQRDAVQWGGLARAGWKVGATSEAAQTLLDVGGPATAPLLAPLCFSSPTELAMFPGQNTSVESEFAFRFAQPLPARDADYVLDEVLDAIGTLMPAIEVVACRFEGGFPDLGETRLIADMVANVAWVEGQSSGDWRGRDLSAHPVRLSRNGEHVVEGSGADVLGNPLNVLLWTANHLSSLGDGIAAGEVISTGTCTGVVAVEPGDVMTAGFGDLGQVEVGFRAAGESPNGVRAGRR